MELPTDVYPLILQNLEIPAREKKLPFEENYPNRVVMQDANNFLNASLVCKQWDAVISGMPKKWETLHKEMNGNHKVAKKKPRSERFYKTLVYCACEQERLDKEIHDYVSENRLVYRSLKIGRIFKTSELGIRKLKRLGKEKLKGKKKQHFLALTKRYDKIHRTYLDMCNIAQEYERGF